MCRGFLERLVRSRVASHFSLARRAYICSGLHEDSRLSDAQVVAIKRLQYLKEIKEADTVLASEAKQQQVRGHRRNLQRGFKHHFRASELANQDLASVFSAVDTDGSGTIDVVELVAMFKDVFGRDLTEADARELMRAADIDGDASTISAKELQKMVMPARLAVRQAEL